MIAHAMLYAVSVSVPVMTAAWFVARFLRAHGRPERGVWAAALAATLLFPAFMLSRPRATPSVTWLAPVQVEPVTFVADQVSAPTQSLPAQSLNVDALLLAVWLVLSVALSARWALSAMRLRSLRRSWISETLDGVRVTLTPELGPAVTGMLRPRIIVPAWVPALPPHQRALVLLHEQEHIRARDPWLDTFARISKILSPWNPAAWLLGVGLQRAVELDCDRRVLRRHPSIESYGETLLAVSARGSNRLTATAAFAETDVPLRKRILAMTTPPRAMSALGVFGAIAVGAAIVSSTAAVPVPTVRVELSPTVPALRDDASSLVVASAVSPAVAMPAPQGRVSSTVNEDVPTPVSDSSPEQAQQALAEPRVIPDPGRWMDIYRSIADQQAGNPPLARVPWASRDSAFAAIWATLGDSALFRRLIADARDAGGVLSDSVRALLPVGVASVALPSDPAPPTAVPPRILNPDEIVHAIAAAYPRTLLDQGWGGTVGMQFLVGPAGEVQATRIRQISAYPALDSAAMQVASVYRFSPALRDDEPVAVWVAHAISFYPPQ